MIINRFIYDHDGIAVTLVLGAEDWGSNLYLRIVSRVVTSLGQVLLVSRLPAQKQCRHGQGPEAGLKTKITELYLVDPRGIFHISKLVHTILMKFCMGTHHNVQIAGKI